MTRVLTPQAENSVQSLALALSKAVISQVPVAGNLINEFIDKTNQKLIDNGHKIFLEEVSKGRIDLSDHEKEAFIPIGYRYYRAVSEGTVNRNLHLLAKLIRRQIEDHDLSYEKYVTLENAIRDLSYPEMIALSEICKQIGLTGSPAQWDTTENRIITVENYEFTDFEDLEDSLLNRHPTVFDTQIAVRSVFTLLSGKGLVLPTTNTRINDTMAKFLPTKMVDSVKEATKEIEIPSDIAETTAP